MEAAASACETPLSALIEAGVTFLDQVMRLLPRIDPEEKPEKAGDLENDLRNLEGDYQILKAELLEAGVQGRLAVTDMDARLRAASAIRRAMQQAAKAAQLLETETSASDPEETQQPEK